MSRFFDSARNRRLIFGLGRWRELLKKSGRPPEEKKLHFDHLEPRAVPATLTVSILDDDSVLGDNFLSLREAINAANTDSTTGMSAAELAQISGMLGDDTIEFDSALFNSGAQTLSLTNSQLTISSNLMITGPGQDVLTIDAGGNSRIFNVDDGDNSNDAVVVISGLTLTGGSVTGPSATGSGGAVFNRESLTLTNSTLSGNSATNGGGVRNLNGFVSVTNSTISGNSTGDDGGGVYNTGSSGTVSITNSTISSNSAEGVGAGIYNSATGSVILEGSLVSGNSTGSDGGGIFNFNGGTVTILDSTIAGNSGTNGGGIFNQVSGSSVTLTNSTITANTSSSDGGGVINQGQGTLIVSDSTFSDNFSGSDGGGIYNQNGGSTVTVDTSTFTGNFATQLGGGVHNQGNGSLTLTDSVISGNTASSGGGLSNPFNGTTTLTNATVSNNHADNDGGGIYMTSGALTMLNSTIAQNVAVGSSGGVHNTSTITILNTIIAGNSDDGTAPDVSGAVNATSSLIQDTTGAAITGTGNLLNVDPMLGPLADNGGATFTHALLAGSPAIDAGDNTAANNASLTTDQRGAPFGRIIDGGVGTATVDIGAYERQTVTFAFPFEVDTLVDESDGDFSDGDRSLREMIGLANGSIGADTITFDPSLGGGTILLTLGELAVTDDLTITGLGADQLTIDAGGASRIFNVNDGDNSNTATVAISGLTLAGGSVSGDGGAVFNREDLTISQSTISGNSASVDGGGIYSRDGSLSVLSSTISGNSAGFGGGVFNRYGTASIVNSTISGNGAVNDAGGVENISGTFSIVDSIISGNSTGYSGGGVRNVDGTVSIFDSTISGNSAAYHGGGVYSRYGTASISDSTISGNSAGVGFGGGVGNYGGSVSITNSTVSGNSASSGGGASNRINGTLSITNSTLSGNDAAEGGGVDNLSGTLSVANSTFSGNTALNGGAVYNSDLAAVTNSTISGNSAVTSGGGVYNYAAGTLTLANSIVANSAAGGDVAGAAVTATGVNIVEDGSVTGTSVLNVDPILGPLQDNGGPTFTHALLPGSPAVDAGDNAAANDAGLTTDQRGLARFVNGTVDIGALEVQNTRVVTGAGPGAEPHVIVRDENGQIVHSFLAYNQAFGGGVRVATADFNGDGTPDIVTAAGRGGFPHVRVFDGVDLSPMASFFAYTQDFLGGVFVATGDVNNDGTPDLITGSGAGGPHVKVFDGNNFANELASFFAFNQGFRGGVRVASADIDGDGGADVIAAAGAGGGPRVKVFGGGSPNNLLANFLAFGSGFSGGVFVAAGDVNNDGAPDVITGAGAGGTPRVKVFDGGSSVLANFLAFGSGFRGGVRVGSADLNRDGHVDVIAGAGPGADPRVKVFDGADTNNVLSNFLAFGAGFDGGVFVGGSLVTAAPSAIAPLTLAQPALVNSSARVLTLGQLETAVDDALSYFSDAGLSSTLLTDLGQLRFTIEDLPGSRLGEASPGRITIDANAAGYGWSLDDVVDSDEVDLLSVIAHELGHAIGLDHHDDGMDARLSTGQRRLPSRHAIDELMAELEWDVL